MKKKTLTFEEKLKKYTVPYKEIRARFSPQQIKEIEVLSQYYSLLMELHRLRKKLRLTQKELAKRSSVPRTTISKIESGDRNVTIETLSKLAAGMGKSLKISFV